MSTYLIISPTGDGWKNMAAEEFLMDRAGPDDAAILFYINRNAVIIGRNQNPWAECRLREMETDGVQLVRRISGGGAVYHDRGNLNYSFVMGKRRYDLRKQTELILEAVRALGIPCEFSGRNDLLADGRKFSGNAFCERGQAMLHHGTLLIRTDLEKLQKYLTPDTRKLAAKGIRSVRSRVCNLSEFRPEITTESVLGGLAHVCRNAFCGCAELRMEDLAGGELEKYTAKHSSAEWRLGKSLPFDYEVSHRFPWGSVQLLLRLKGGRVESLDVYTDANEVSLADKISNGLHGAAFGSETLSRPLRTAKDSRLEELADYLMTLDL